MGPFRSTRVWSCCGEPWSAHIWVCKQAVLLCDRSHSDRDTVSFMHVYIHSCVTEPERLHQYKHVITQRHLRQAVSALKHCAARMNNVAELSAPSVAVIDSRVTDRDGEGHEIISGAGTTPKAIFGSQMFFVSIQISLFAPFCAAPLLRSLYVTQPSCTNPCLMMTTIRWRRWEIRY